MVKESAAPGVGSVAEPAAPDGIVTAVPPVEPMKGVITKWEIGSPPLTPTVHETTADWLPATAATAEGKPGTPVGVTVLVFTDAVPVPTELMDETVNEYVVPSTMPMLNVAVSCTPGVGSRLDPTAVAVTSCVELTVVPTNAVSRKLTMGAPPLAPTVQLTVAAESSGAAETADGRGGDGICRLGRRAEPERGECRRSHDCEHGDDWTATEQACSGPSPCPTISSP